MACRTDGGLPSLRVTSSSSRSRCEVELLAAATAANCPCVVRLLGVAHGAAATLVALELVCGGTLLALMNRLRRAPARRLCALAEATAVGACVARALVCLHTTLGVAHRDLKARGRGGRDRARGAPPHSTTNDANAVVGARATARASNLKRDEACLRVLSGTARTTERNRRHEDDDDLSRRLPRGTAVA